MYFYQTGYIPCETVNLFLPISVLAYKTLFINRYSIIANTKPNFCGADQNRNCMLSHLWWKWCGGYRARQSTSAGRPPGSFHNLFTTESVRFLKRKYFLP